MENGTYFTIGQAAEQTGKAKSTIKKAIDSGELSVAEKTKRGFKIDAAELFRVFPRKQEETDKNGQNEQSETAEERIQNSILEAKLKIAQERYDEAREIIEDLRSDRDAWKHQATALIEDKSDKKRGFMARLFG